MDGHLTVRFKQYVFKRKSMTTLKIEHVNALKAKTGIKVKFTVQTIVPYDKLLQRNRI